MSFQNEKGEPDIVEKVTILPPQSRMGTITTEERNELIKNSRLYKKYENVKDEFSAKEKLDKLNKEKEEELKKQEIVKEESKVYKTSKKSKNTLGKRVENKIINKGTTKLVNYLFKKVFK